MGYTTDFSGKIIINPPLNNFEIEYLREFNRSRRQSYADGPYVTADTADMSTDFNAHNTPPTGQPGLWCQWVPTDDGSALEWDGGEKFYNSAEWMTYIIDTFLKPGANLYQEMQNAPSGWNGGNYYPTACRLFTFDHVMNGVIEAQGEETSDHWWLMVKDNTVHVHHLSDVLSGSANSIRNMLDYVQDIQDHPNGGVNVNVAVNIGSNDPDDHGTQYQRMVEDGEFGDDVEPDGPSYADTVNAPMTEATAREIGRQIASGDYPRFRRPTNPHPMEGVAVIECNPDNGMPWTDDDEDDAEYNPDLMFWIWSNKHQLWWGPNRRGYVSFPGQAGQYTASEASAIINHSMRGILLGQNRAVPDSIMVPVGDTIPDDAE